MKLKELIEDCGSFAETEVTGVTCDSRKVNNGMIFVCIDGTASDGHKYVTDAVKKGAALIIAQKDTGVGQQIIVKNTRQVYASICAKWFGNPADGMKIIGVTGTNGKTSVSYMLKTVLEHAGHKVGLIGTIQNMIGDETVPAKNTTPDAYALNSLFSLMKSAGCDTCVMEVSSHALDQDRVYGIKFDAAVFTNLTQDHLDYHKTMENYCAAKRKLFTQTDLAIVNYDDPYSKKLVEGLPCRVCTYSAVSDEATYTAKDIYYKPDGVKYHFNGYNLISRIRLATGGKFSVYNSMAAASCAVELGIPLDTVAAALTEMKGVKGRAESVPNDFGFSVIIDYAHTPDGLKNILSTFKECEKNRLIAVFGCGGDRDKTKRPKMGAIAEEYADYVIVTSDNPRSEDPNAIISDIVKGMKCGKTPYEVIPDRISAIKFAVHNARKGDIIVLAGKGHEDYQILKNRTVHLDEREVVAEAFRELKEENSK